MKVDERQGNVCDVPSYQIKNLAQTLKRKVLKCFLQAFFLRGFKILLVILYGTPCNYFVIVIGHTSAKRTLCITRYLKKFGERNNIQELHKGAQHLCSSLYGAK